MARPDIESPDDRSHLGKVLPARVLLKLEQEGSNIAFTVTDDGSGVNEQAVLEKAKAQALIPEDMEGLNSKQVMSLLFKTGFSTQTEADLDSGRGVGLDLVAQKVKQAGGRIGGTYKAGAHCRFKIALPTQQ